jgi:NitT/TauT family transport system permease protein
MSAPAWHARRLASSRPGSMVKIVVLAVVVGACLVRWERYGRANPLLVPAPTAIVTAFFDLLASGDLLSALATSARLFFAGLALSAVIGVGLGFLLGRDRVSRLTLGPYLSALYVTPEIVFVPILAVWLGYTFEARLVVVVLAAVFPILYNSMAGAREAPTLEEMARSFGASKLRIILSVVAPGAVAFIIAGVRVSIGRAIVGVVSAEAFLRLEGIGGLIFLYGSQFSPDYLVAAILVLPLVGLGLTYLLGLLERLTMPWRGSQRNPPISAQYRVRSQQEGT